MDKDIKKYSTEFSKLFFGTAVVAIIFLAIFEASTPIIIIVFFIIVISISFSTHKTIANEERKQHNNEIEKFQEQLKISVNNLEQARIDENLWKKTLLERASGFPSLINRILEYEKLRDDGTSYSLRVKSHPAYKASDVVKEEAKRRREAEFIRKKTEAIIEYYEYLAPFLLDVKEDVDIDQAEIFGEYTEEEQQDPAINYLTKEEYRKLPAVERNQLALDRFWKRPNKSKWLIGKLYERYVGYLYEKDGYNVEYHGIQYKLEDLGIDLICKKNNEIVLIQCKNWASFRTIYEKHIFQFFGTFFQYRDSNPGKKIRAVFCTTTKLSELATKFANALGIELKENFKFDQSYPCIKCNINNSTNEKIYHLPFDQQYDKTKILGKNEIYCRTTKEAEVAGFRRAFRWHGSKSDG
ncbi:MAG: restriction endonuclease [Candidatus Falkowbacteria bacterium]|nr:restriction endonuclease [Candidatus Falkowbacteria bacterium]